MPIDLMASFEAELQGERASALGDAGRRLEATLAALNELAADAAADRVEECLDEAATAAWHYMIVRETAGMHDHREAFEVYGVPARVMARVGVMKKSQA